MSDETLAKNTAHQEAALKAQEDAWAEEQSWPIFQVVLEGDEVPWVPRRDERYWQPEDPDDPESEWVPKDELPDEARVEAVEVVRKGKAAMVPHVFRVARAEVTCHARSEEQAKMLALRDNPEYYTVVSVKQLET